MHNFLIFRSVGSEKVEHNISTDQSSVSSETSRSRNRSRGVSRCTKPRRAGSLQRSKSVGSVPNPTFTPDGGKPSWEHDCVEYYGKDGELGGVLPEKYSVDGEAPFSPEIHERSNLIVYSQALPPSYVSLLTCRRCENFQRNIIKHFLNFTEALDEGSQFTKKCIFNTLSLQRKTRFYVIPFSSQTQTHILNIVLLKR